MDEEKFWDWLFDRQEIWDAAEEIISKRYDGCNPEKCKCPYSEECKTNENAYCGEILKEKYKAYVEKAN